MNGRFNNRPGTKQRHWRDLSQLALHLTHASIDRKDDCCPIPSIWPCASLACWGGFMVGCDSPSIVVECTQHGDEWSTGGRAAGMRDLQQRVWKGRRIGVSSGVECQEAQTS